MAAFTLADKVFAVLLLPYLLMMLFGLWKAFGGRKTYAVTD